MSEPAPIAHFVALFRTAGYAREFEDEAARVAGATNIMRTGRQVAFDAPTQDEAGYPTLPDIMLSVGYYGGRDTRLNGVVVPYER